MSKVIKLKKGFDIKLAGKATLQTGEVEHPELFALKPDDFPGFLRPKELVKQGDTVKAGTPILFDKKMPDIKYCAPVSGEIVEVKRGEKRKLLEVKILADKTMEYESFPSHSMADLSSLSREVCQDLMLKSGVWPNIIQRPYGIVANPADTPKAIFISAFDSHPLAPDYDYLFKNNEVYIKAGIEIIRKFTDEDVNIGLNADGEVSSVFSNLENVKTHKFSGPHPSGNVGIQIHHINPINKNERVWTLDPWGLVQIGRLFIEGKYDTEKLFAVAGSEVKEPKYYKTYVGACINKFVDGNLNNDHIRFISGNVLTGSKIEKDGFLGFYDHLLTVIPEGDYYELFGWIAPSTKKLSLQSAIGLFSFLNKKDFKLDTNTRGQHRAFVQTGVFEKLLPMDVFPVFLLKAIMAEDFDNMEALGIYEVIEEDFALCEFADVSKHDVQAIIRDGINLMRESEV